MTVQQWRLVRRITGVVYFVAFVIQGVVLLRGGRLALAWVLVGGAWLLVDRHVEKLEEDADGLDESQPNPTD